MFLLTFVAEKQTVIKQFLVCVLLPFPQNLPLLFKLSFVINKKGKDFSYTGNFLGKRGGTAGKTDLK